MDIDFATTIEEAIRKLRGIRYLLSNLSYVEDLDPGQSDMYELLARTIDGIADDLAPIPKELMEHNL